MKYTHKIGNIKKVRRGLLMLVPALALIAQSMYGLAVNQALASGTGQITGVRYSVLPADKSGPDRIVIDQRFNGFIDASSYKATLHRADGSTVSREGFQPVLNIINGSGPLTTQFRIAGNYGDSLLGPQSAVWTSATRPVGVTIEVGTTSGGTVVFSEPNSAALNEQRALYTDIIPADTTAPAAPVLSITGLRSGQVTRTTNVTASWNKPSSDTARYEYNYWNNIPGNPYSEASPYVVETTQQSYAGAFNQGSGTHFMRVRAIDEAGNASAWSNVFTVVYDNINPQTTFITPTGLVGNIFTVRGTASDNESLNRVYVQLVNRQNSQRYGGTTIHLNGTQKEWAHEFNATELNLPNGDYAAHVSVVDNAGNSSAVGWSENFKLDKVIPSITIKSGTGANDGTVGAHPYYQRISFKLHDQSGNLKEVVLNGHVYTRTGTWNDLNWLNITKSHLNEGENSIFVLDQAGNRSETIVFTYDSKAPEVVSLTHSNNNDNQLVNVDVTSTLTVSEAIQTPQGWAPVEGSGATQFTKVSSSNNKGNMTISDLAGNQKTFFFEVKRIDKTPPSFNVADGANMYQSVFDVVVTEENIQSIKVNGTPVAFSSNKPQYSFSVNGYGTYAVTALDKAGNETTVTFTLARTLILVANSISTNTSTPQISGTAFWNDEAGGPAVGEVITIAINGAIYTAVVNADGTWSYTIPTENELQDGDYQVDITAGSNATPISRTITIAAESENPNTGGGNENTNGQTGGNNSGGNTDAGAETEALATGTQAITAPFTTFGVAFNADGTISATPLPESSDTDGEESDNGDVLGAADNLAQSAANQADGNGLKLFGVDWYWILLVLATASGLWWIIAGKRRKNEEQA